MLCTLPDLKVAWPGILYVLIPTSDQAFQKIIGLTLQSHLLIQYLPEAEHYHFQFSESYSLIIPKVLLIRSI